MAVLIGYPEGRRAFGAPREILPERCSVGDVFELRFVRDEAVRASAENRRLLDGPSVREGGRS